MHYGKIIYYDTANARGLSTVLFVSGCNNYCSGCHNKNTWDFNYGKEYTTETENKILNSLNNIHVKNLVITGGEPFHKKNIDCISTLCLKAKKMYDKNIIVYTGYKIKIISYPYGSDEILIDRYYNKPEPLFSGAAPYDYIIDGKYDETLPTNTIDYRGSTNQRCFKIKEYPHHIIYCNDVTYKYFRYSNINV